MISPVVKIAARRIRRQAGKSVLFLVAIFFSVALASFFVCFLQGFSFDDLANGASFSAFNQQLQQFVGITVIFLAAGAFFTVRDHSSMRRKECADVMAVLTSVGASKRQKRILLRVELYVLCYPSVCVGALAGALLACLYVGKPFSLVTVLLVFLIGCIFLAVSYLLPSFTKRSVIQSVKRQNLNADRETHGYRQSRTFRSQSLLKRLADKSVDYYIDTYRRIASALALAAFYPTLALLLFNKIAEVDVFVGGGGDFDTFEKILAFLLLAFLVLALLGFAHVFLLMRAHLTNRKIQEKIYLSIGLTVREYKRVCRLEIRGLALRAIAYFVAWVLLAYFLFESV